MIQRQLTDKLALALLEARVREGDAVSADARDGDLVLEVTGDRGVGDTKSAGTAETAGATT